MTILNTNPFYHLIAYKASEKSSCRYDESCDSNLISEFFVNKNDLIDKIASILNIDDDGYFNAPSYEFQIFRDGILAYDEFHNQHHQSYYSFYLHSSSQIERTDQNLVLVLNNETFIIDESHDIMQQAKLLCAQSLAAAKKAAAARVRKQKVETKRNKEHKEREQYEILKLKFNA